MGRLADAHLQRFLIGGSLAVLGLGWFAARGGGKGLGAPAAHRAAPSQAHSTAEKVSRRQFDYLDDEGEGRVLAEVTAVLRVSGGGGWLSVSVSATGPNVDPAPGFRGVQGANIVTAMELERLLASDALVVQVREVSTGRVGYGSYAPGKRGPVPQRRLLSDGSIDYQAESAEEYALGLTADSGPLEAGDYEMALHVAGRPRLTIGFQVHSGEGRILTMRTQDPGQKRDGETADSF